MQIAEPDVDLQATRKFRLAGHLAASLACHRPAQHGGQPFDLPGDAFQRRLGGAAAHLAENKRAGLAVDRRAHRLSG